MNRGLGSTPAALVHGTFATLVAAELEQDIPGLAIISAGDAIPRDATAYLLLAGGRNTALRDRLDADAFAREIPGFGLELLPTRIVCGPVTIPGRTACYACYLARGQQHRITADVDVASATLGLAEGFGPQHVAIARGLAGQAWSEVAAGPVGLGATVRSFDLVSGAVGLASTVAVDRCDRCSRRFRARRDADAELTELS